jgi:hypothetical protein
LCRHINSFVASIFYSELDRRAVLLRSRRWSARDLAVRSRLCGNPQAPVKSSGIRIAVVAHSRVRHRRFGQIPEPSNFGFPSTESCRRPAPFDRIVCFAQARSIGTPFDFVASVAQSRSIVVPFDRIVRLAQARPITAPFDFVASVAQSRSIIVPFDRIVCLAHARPITAPFDFVGCAKRPLTSSCQTGVVAHISETIP